MDEELLLSTDKRVAVEGQHPEIATSRPPRSKRAVRIADLDGVANERWLRLADVAAILAMDYSTIYELCTSGQLPFVRVGRTLRVQVGELRAFVAAHRVPRARPR